MDKPVSGHRETTVFCCFFFAMVATFAPAQGTQRNLSTQEFVHVGKVGQLVSSQPVKSIGKIQPPRKNARRESDIQTLSV